MKMNFLLTTIFASCLVAVKSASSDCDLFVDKDSPSKFYKVAPFGPVSMSCAPTTFFSQHACGCISGLVGCLLNSVPGDPESYRVYEPQKGWKKMPCAKGTYFSQRICTCTSGV